MKNSQRSCDGCTKCCEGWLSGEVRGNKMGPTEDVYSPKPCIFVNKDKGCSIYNKRPKSPCKTFSCEWINNPDIAEKLKPNAVNILPIKSKTRNGIPYLAIIECGEKMDPDSLSWYILYAMSNRINFAWTVNGNTRWFGHPDFMNEMSSPGQTLDFK